MPNLCYSEYTFSGTDSNLKKLHDTITSALKNNEMQGREANALSGLLHEVNAKIEHIHGCDTIDNLSDVENGKLNVSTQTAWTYNAATWQTVLEKLGLKDAVKFAFYAEEPNADIYVNYDPHEINPDSAKYVVDYCIENHAACSTEKAVKYLQILLDYESSDITELFSVAKDIASDPVPYVQISIEGTKKGYNIDYSAEDRKYLKENEIIPVLQVLTNSDLANVRELIKLAEQITEDDDKYADMRIEVHPIKAITNWLS